MRRFHSSFAAVLSLDDFWFNVSSENFWNFKPKFSAIAMESRHLWLLLTCYQFEALRKGEEVQPDEYSRSFGMRVDPANTDGLDYPSPLTEFGAAYHLKDYVFVIVEVTSSGFKQKGENNTLVKLNDNVYQWHASLRRNEFDKKGNLLYRIVPEAHSPG